MRRNLNNTTMAVYSITLDKRTLFGKNMFNFLVGMNYIDENDPNYADIDERTIAGRKTKKMLFEFGILKNKKSEKEKEKEELTKIFSLINKGKFSGRPAENLLSEL